MAITEKQCACGCGEKFYGTKRRMYFDNTCKNRVWRKVKANDSKQSAVTQSK